MFENLVQIASPTSYCLSAWHRDEVEEGCPASSLTAELSRLSEAMVKGAKQLADGRQAASQIKAQPKPAKKHCAF
jgi:hypothetical protein